MPVFKIHHRTTYEYDRLVKESVNEIKIFPFQSDDQEVLQHDLMITADPAVHVYYDYWNNKTGVFNLLPAHNLLAIESRLIVRTNEKLPLNAALSSGFEELQAELNGNLNLLELSIPDSDNALAALREIISELYEPSKTIAQFTEDCCHYIYERFKYIKGITDIETTVEQVLQQRAGVCQDFAHVMLQVLRTLSIPCRYVSGYICPNKNGMRGEGATHAWVEVYIPHYGWAGIDPTNNIWVSNKHIKLAVGRNYHDCAPLKGTFKGPALQKLSVYVSVGYEDGQVFGETNDVRIKNLVNVPQMQGQQ